MSDRQVISKVQNSTIIQVWGDLIINSGLSLSNLGAFVKELVADIKEVVASELANCTRNADRIVEERLQHFSDDLVEQIANRVTDKLDRFNEPSVQNAVHDAALSFVKSGNESYERVLIDLLIERVRVEEHTTLQRLIDQAIKVVPVLSPACLDLLSLVVFRHISYSGTRDKMLDWIKSMGGIIQRASRISNLDIAFLSQADCVSSIPGSLLTKKWCDIFRERYDLFFRHPVPRDVSAAFMQKYSVRWENRSLLFDEVFLRNNVAILSFLSAFLFHSDGTITFNLTDTKTLLDGLQRGGLDNLRSDIETLVQSSRVFQQQEVRRFFVGIDPNWDDAISLLDGEPLRSIQILPVGFYIGTRQLSMLSGRDVPFDIFYQ
jgi:hypothetical protein